MIKVWLVLTHACNLACTYCYTGDKKPVRMAPDVASRALSFAFDAARSSPLQLGFFGGEPLVERDLLLSVAAEARARADAHHLPLTLQLTTNGTLLDEPLARSLAALDVRLALSLDGTREHNDQARLTRGGASSYDDVDRAFTLLRSLRIPFDVISVVDPPAVHLLARSVRHLVDRGVTRLTLNTNYGAPWSPDDLSALVAALDHVGAIWMARMRRGDPVSIEPLDSAVALALRQARGPLERCGSGETSFAIAPSGRIYGCPRSVGEDSGQAALGHIDQGLTRRHLGHAVPEGCEGCDAAERCERHCACACAEETGDPTRPGPVLCTQQAALESLARRLVDLLGDEQASAFIERFAGATELA